jgi:hypothetical protein
VSRLIGLSGERCTLRSSHSSLAEAARRAAYPSWLWLAGLAYPTLSVSLFIGWDVVLGLRVPGDVAASSLYLPLVFFPIFRLIPGLARVSSPAFWEGALAAGRRPGWRSTWRAGRGLLRSSLALWLQVAALEALVLALSFGLFDWAAEHATTPVAVVIGGPVLLMMVCYALVLSVLYQLALHSLAQNRRGVASALQHAWRLARNDPWALVRATFVDLELSLVVFGLARLISNRTDEAKAEVLLVAVLLGWIGVTRAGYWARTYRALGGLAPDDGVPGLAGASAGGGAR